MKVGLLSDEQGQVTVLEAGETTIGRDRASTVRLPPDEQGVSRHHARIVRSSGGYFVEDLNSTNGTLLNGQRLPPRQMISLPAGGVLQIGLHHFTFQLHDRPEGVRSPGAAPAGAARMVPRLLVRWPNGQAQATWAGRALVIGREPTCDVPVPWPGLSRQHARVEAVPEGFAIADLNSRNHVWHQGRAIQRQVLRPGDVFSLGGEVHVQIDFVPAHADDEASPHYHLTPLSGKTQMSIGRSADNDFVIPHPQVSRRHARLYVQGNRFLIEDLGSTHGTFINGQRISDRHEIRAGDDIRVAGQRVVLTRTESGQTVMGAIRDGGNIRLDAQGLTKVVRQKGKDIPILRDVSLSIQPGEFVTLIGGSGAGKSTLLKALSGFAQASSGAVYYNGQNYYANFDAYRSTVGYVPQNEIIHLELPTRETLLYAARLRFPSDTSSQEIETRVDAVLRQLGLADRAQTPVGRLSGGQRKRVSIAVELLTRPDLLFLDEPCSGLDPGTERKLMRQMRQMADKGQTVILVTHNIDNIDLCDQIAFLGYGGRLVYYGPPQRDIRAYFGVEDLVDIYGLLEQTPGATPLGNREATSGEMDRSAEQWRQRFRKSPQHREYVETPQHNLQQAARLRPAPAGPTARVSGLRQLLILCQRYIAIIGRDTKDLVLKLAQAPILAILMGLVFKRDVLTVIKLAPDTDHRTMALGLVFLTVIVAIWLGAFNSSREIVKEVDIYLRERAVGLKLLPYVTSKILVLGVLCFVQSLILVAVLNLFLEMPKIDDLFPRMLLTLFLTALAATAMGLLISAISSTQNQANTLMPLLLIPQVIFAGMILTLESMGDFGTFMSKLMISRWAFVALGTVVDVERIEAIVPDTTKLIYNGDPRGPFNVEVPQYWLILGGFVVLFTALTLYFQWRKDEWRKK